MQLDKQIEIQILKVLSDFIPRNQNDITKAIGRSSQKSADRVKVHRAIKRTEKYFKRSQPKLEDSGKIWVLKKDLDTIKQMVLDYQEELLPFLKTNEIILNMLVDKHVKQVCTDEWLSELQKSDFKNRLKISTTFFRLYLFESPKELLKTMETLFSLTKRGQEFERLNRSNTIQKYGFARYKPSFNDMLDAAFMTCVCADVLYHRECNKGIELVKNIKTLEL